MYVLKIESRDEGQGSGGRAYSHYPRLCRKRRLYIHPIYSKIKKTGERYMLKKHRINVAQWQEMRDLEHMITSATVLSCLHFISFSPRKTKAGSLH